MKSIILISSLFLVTCFSFSQDAKDILEQCGKNCKPIQSGYYEMIMLEKNFTAEDTNQTLQRCHFQKNNSPTKSRFHYTAHDKETTHSSLYSGDNYISYSTSDSSGIVWAYSSWKEDIKSFLEDVEFYPPFGINQNVFPRKGDYKEQGFRIQMLEDSFVEHVPCYHIQVNYPVENDPGSPFLVIDLENHFWISKDQILPIQFSENFVMVMNGDTMGQYMRYTLLDFSLNERMEDSIFSKQSIPEYINLKDYKPREYLPPPPLPLDTLAPHWSFPSLTDDTISLGDFKGKLVLVDFFYKHCAGCILAFPMLQSMYEKYNDRGLVVVGIDPIDGKEDNLPAYLAKKKVHYPVVYASRDIAKSYRVTAYPTLFLLDREGKILFIKQGYHEGQEAELEKLILKYL